MYGAERPDAVEELALAGDLDLGAAEFALVVMLHPAAEAVHHGLLAVADAEHGHTEREDGGGRLGRAVEHHAGRAAGKDDGPRLLARDGRIGGVKGHDFAEDAALADAAHDELGDLRSEIDDENRGHGVLGEW